MGGYYGGYYGYPYGYRYWGKFLNKCLMQIQILKKKIIVINISKLQNQKLPTEVIVFKIQNPKYFLHIDIFLFLCTTRHYCFVFQKKFQVFFSTCFFQKNFFRYFFST